jgi:hypothetical protein
MNPENTMGTPLKTTELLRQRAMKEVLILTFEKNKLAPF